MNNKLTDIVNDINDAYNAYHRKINNSADEFRTLVLEEFRQAFLIHPQYKSAEWIQYTPSFNDGDVCEFSISDVELVDSDGTNVWRLPEEFKEISKIIHSNYDLSKKAFDEYVTLKVVFDGENVSLESEEYYE